MRRVLATCALTFAVVGLLGAEPREKPVAVGEQAPDFALSDQTGAAVKLSDSYNKRPVVLVFYRGYW